MIVTERPVVGTESGSVQGIVEDGVAAFRGIPYAASPLGDRRFAAPEQHPTGGWDRYDGRSQAAVLSWVKRNITAFGGDPGSLTVGGQSAGAFSALYLALSPVTGPQIKRVITQSGPWGLPPQDPGQAADHARRFLTILGLERSPDPVAALRTVPAGDQQTPPSARSRPKKGQGAMATTVYGVSGVGVVVKRALGR
ncbi:carboxylesterase family protein [Nonomuraea sp. NPDC049695]|uniref:carboxylesterase family protein n=1 Tax=Nonomuraea sp. NPDC049695 TaxID=3154734 RepID=UPI00342AAC7D